MKRESILKARCVVAIKEALPGFVVINHQEVRLNGVPDTSITGCGRTTWIEFKHGTPHFDSRGIQELTMLRLSGAGTAWYVIYLEDEEGLNKRTMIVAPRHLKGMQPETMCVGHNHKFVVDFIKKVHRV